MRRLKSGETLVGMLVVIAIIAILAAVALKGSGVFSAKGSPRADGRGTTIPGLVKANAEDTVCRNYLGQLRASLEIAKTNNDDQFPAALEDTKLGSTFYGCPMGKGKEPYQYDPQTGKVWCTHPGHEKY